MCLLTMFIVEYVHVLVSTGPSYCCKATSITAPLNGTGERVPIGCAMFSKKGTMQEKLVNYAFSTK